MNEGKGRGEKNGNHIIVVWMSTEQRLCSPEFWRSDSHTEVNKPLYVIIMIELIVMNEQRCWLPLAGHLSRIGGVEKIVWEVSAGAIAEIDWQIN